MRLSCCPSRHAHDLCDGESHMALTVSVHTCTVGRQVAGEHMARYGLQRGTGFNPEQWCASGRVGKYVFDIGRWVVTDN